ncbi:putative non-catalytic module family expn protein [Lyophyllum shimeji]|uniref:Non-catalytic module family expn protein n=1 Tax=Lyophyllum shimeji TaxID=47721 RepID=A0A9P3PLA1_LYOSH|nr:putative non-catalytic module family expn protein [Lyophyllum shimeji]
MATSFGFYMLFAAWLAAFFSAVAVAAPAVEKRGLLGKATYYAVGLGSCGQTNTDSEYVVALNPVTYAGGSHCGKQVKITDKTTGTTATATVRDTCPGCGINDLDMSPSLFQHFASLDKGVFQMEWTFI